MNRRTVEQLRFEAMVINIISLSIIGLCVARVMQWI